MAVTKKSYSVTCPDPACAHAFEVKKSKHEMDSEDDLTKCPKCKDEFFSDFDEDTKTLTLVIEEEEDEEEDDEGEPE